jgi:hypothetical protein
VNRLSAIFPDSPINTTHPSIGIVLAARLHDHCNINHNKYFFVMKFITLFTLFLFACQLQAQAVTQAEVAAELNGVIKAMEVYHCDAYHYADSTAIATLRDQLLADLPAQPNQMDAYRAVNQLVCGFGDGHTRVWDRTHRKNFLEAGGQHFPFAVDVRNNRLFIRKDFRGTDASLLGQEILSMNGVPATTIIATAAAHASRESYELDQALLSHNFDYYLWLAYGASMTDEVAVELAGPEGRKEGGQLLTIQGLTELPKTATPEQPVFEVKMLDNNIAYLRIDHFEGRPKTYAKEFKRIFQQFADAGAQQLILDMRNHGGGDSRIGDELARYIADAPFRQFAFSEWKATPELKDAFKNAYLPKAVHWALPLIKGMNAHTKAIYSTDDHATARVEYPLIKPYTNDRAFTGEVIMLMDNNTFSAGTCFAAMFKDYQMGTIVGQESGNLANFHADGLLRMSLQASGAQLQISNSYLVRPSGDESPLAVQPDLAISYDQDALEVALELLSNERLSRLK